MAGELSIIGAILYAMVVGWLAVLLMVKLTRSFINAFAILAGTLFSAYSPVLIGLAPLLFWTLGIGLIAGATFHLVFVTRAKNHI